MWEQRNTQVHGHDNATRTLANQRQQATEFKHIQAQRSKVLHTDRDLFIGINDDAVDQFVETAMPKFIANWFQVWKPVTAFALQSMSPLTAYFSPLRNSTQSKRPPKPRYTKTSHTRNDGTDCVRRRQHRAPARNHQITRFFSCRSKMIELRTPLHV
jgi:hypothetical protein